MSEANETEQGLVNLKTYDVLLKKYPVDMSPPPEQDGSPSFPDWEVTDEERKWATDFLSVGSNDQLLKDFGRYVGFVGKSGLQLLRDSSTRLSRETEDVLTKDLSKESLLGYLRSEFQTDTLFFEEGLRGARNIDNKYWNSEEDDQLGLARKWLKKSKSAFREMNDFVDGKTNKLSSVRVLIESKYNVQKNAMTHNENHFRKEADKGENRMKWASTMMDHDSGKLVFWSSLSSFVDNLELSKH